MYYRGFLLWHQAIYFNKKASFWLKIEVSFLISRKTLISRFNKLPRCRGRILSTLSVCPLCIFFGAKEFFYIIFDNKNGCKNDFKDNNEKSYSWSRNRVSRKIDFKVLWLRNSNADSVGVNWSFMKDCLAPFVKY